MSTAACMCAADVQLTVPHDYVQSMCVLVRYDEIGRVGLLSERCASQGVCVFTFDELG